MTSVEEKALAILEKRERVKSRRSKMDELLEADKRGIMRLVKPIDYNENVPGLPKFKETEAKIQEREAAGLAVQEEWKHKPRSLREAVFKPAVLGLKALGVPFQKVESMIANPLMELQRADQPNLGARLAQAVKEGATGERIGELGDVPRRAGFGEGVSRFIGFGAAMGTAFPVASKGLKAVAGTVRKAIGIKELTPLQTAMRNIRRIRWVDIALGHHESAVYRRKLTQALTPDERKLLLFMREGQRSLNPVTKQLVKGGKGGAIPEKLAESKKLIKLMKDPKVREKLKPWVEQDKFKKAGLDTIDAYLDKAHMQQVKAMGSNIGYWENYITHIWDIPKNKIKPVAKYFMTRNPTLQKRFISTINEGVNKFGLKPKTLDVAEILGIYDDLRYTTLANRKMVDTLVKMRLVRRQGGKGTDGWRMVDHPAFARTKIVAQKGIKGQGVYEPLGKHGASFEGKILAKQKAPAVVHPEIYEEVKALLDKPFEAGWINKLETVNAISKRLNLALSLFHHVALLESSVATMGLGKTAIALYRTAFKRDPMVFSKLPLAKDGIKAGLSLATPTDAATGKFYSMLQTAEARAGNAAVRGAVKGVNKLSRAWDSGLWDYLHNNLKLMAYEHLKAQALKNPGKYGIKGVNVDKVKGEVAQFVNDTFGGQAWELLGKSPKWVQSMHWALLSPDWTYSTLRQALAPTGVGAMFKETAALRKTLGNKFWLNAAVYFWGGLNVLNYTNTKKITGKGRFMWENPPDKKTMVFLGMEKDKRGTEKEVYLRWGKQFRELPEFFIDPVKKFGGKLSPVVRQAMAQFTGSQIGGFPTEFKEKPFTVGLPDRATELGKMFVPYSLTGENLVGALPKSKGMNYYKARELFMKAISSNDVDAIKEIMEAGARNNVDTVKAFQDARVVLNKSADSKKRNEFAKAISEGKIPAGLTLKERRTIRRLMSNKRSLEKLKRHLRVK